MESMIPHLHCFVQRQTIEDIFNTWRHLSHPGLLPVTDLIYDGAQPALVHSAVVRQNLVQYLKSEAALVQGTRIRLVGTYLFYLYSDIF
jgi:hypothetical protein